VTELPGTAWLAAPGFIADLYAELGLDPAAAGANASLPPRERLLRAKNGGAAAFGDLVYREGPAPEAYWHQNRLSRPFVADFESIKEAADILRGIQRNWAHYPVAAFRRAELIKEKLPYVNLKPKSFPRQVPLAPMGMWSLLDEHTLFASAETSSPFPAGNANFEEDHVNPPSRAYLKLYEALTLADWLHRKAGAEGAAAGQTDAGAADAPSILPGPESRCVDAGACPGGWTWVLDRLGASVTAIDRSELHPSLMAKGNVKFLKHDAFTLSPADFGPQDWVFSDVICYPPRLLEWVEKWLDSGLCSRFVCTVKMQGEADHETTRRFAAVPGSAVVHLGANKHELTWIKL